MQVIALTAMLILSHITPVMSFSSGMNFPNWHAFSQVAEQFKKHKEEERRRIDASNFWVHEEFERIVSEKKEDLLVINALLMRFKEDFRKVREEDNWVKVSSQGVDFPISTQRKATEIFKTDIWKVKPQRGDLLKIVDHIKHEQHEEDVSKQEKIFHTKNKIGDLKKSLIYLRDLSIKKNITPHEIFLNLAEIDFALMIHRSNKNWERYDYVMDFLRNYDK